MPAYLQHFEIDWSWSELTEAERAIVRRHEARAQADPGSHTLETLKEALAVASNDLGDRQICVRAEDDGDVYDFIVQHGQCTDDEDDEFDEEGKFPDSLTAHDYRSAGVEQVFVGLYWPGEMLAAIKAQAVRLDRSLSWVVQRAWKLGQGVAPVAGGGPPRDGAKQKQSVYLPIDLYADLTDIAQREDRSMSFVAQRVIAAAWPALLALTPPTD